MGETELVQLRAFAERLLDRTRATPLPDRESLLGQPSFRIFDRIDDYHREILDVSGSPEPYRWEE